MDLLTMKEAAEFLHQPVATMRFWRASDDLTKPQGRRVGRRVMYRQSDLEKFVGEIFAKVERSGEQMTANAGITISAKVANHALHYRNSDEGFSGGYVSDKFFELCAHADDEYKSRLALAFYEEVAAFELSRTPNGIASLRIIATLTQAG